MKKMIYTLGLIGLISGVANAADDYTCATPPSCASLGYTLTLTTDCIGTPLKCPFDTSKIQCTTKTDAMNKLKADMAKAISPDYTKKLPGAATNNALANNITHTVGQGQLTGYTCVWVQFYSGGKPISGTNYTEWYINGNQVGATNIIDGGGDYIMGFYLLFTGDTFRLKAGMADGNDRLWFFACKGFPKS